MSRESDATLKSIENQINVTPQQVTFAKAYILKHPNQDTPQILQDLLKEMESIMPNEIIIHPTVNTDGMIKDTAKSISWTLAGCQAIWELVHANLLISSGSYLPNPILKWTTIPPNGRSGEYSNWELDRLFFPIPGHVQLPPSASVASQQPLSDPDLFLHTLDIKNMHIEVKESLEEAVRCFRHELYIACLAMLGKASEGAWIELGLKLADTAQSAGLVNAKKIKETLEDQYVGIGKKILETLRLYEKSDIFGDVYTKSDVKIQDLRNAVIWADCVRESRNSVHYGVEPSMPNTYEKVAALLIGAVPHLRLLYQILCAVDSVRQDQ